MPKICAIGGGSLVSIIIPVYNTEKYLTDCLNSVLRQTYKNIEVILVDDGSTDGSGAICDKFCAEYDIFTVYHTKNCGVSHARNFGLEKAKAEYIAFIDSDDKVADDYIQNLFEGLTGDVDLCVSDFAANQYVQTSFTLCFDDYNSKHFQFLNKNFLLYGPFVKLYRRAIIENNNVTFPENLSYGEDLCFNFDYLLACRKIRYIDYHGYSYIRDNPQSLSSKFRDNIYDISKRLFIKITDFMAKKNIEDAELLAFLNRQLFDSGYNYIMAVIHQNNMPKAECNKKIKAILTDSFFIKALKCGDLAGYSQNIIFLMKLKTVRGLVWYSKLRSKK